MEGGVGRGWGANVRPLGSASSTSQLTVVFVFIVTLAQHGTGRPLWNPYNLVIIGYAYYSISSGPSSIKDRINKTLCSLYGDTRPWILVCKNGHVIRFKKVALEFES